MYKDFFKDVEYVMGLFCKPFEDCCEKDDNDEDEKKGCGMGCDCMPCCKEDDDEKKTDGGILGPGPVADILKCMFDASDTDYDYED
ncbi:MAG: hypothetical protein K6G83_10475 [Lachnospiraceae bacterium]|nr:hypothetical protein [Lachnospiraceae bacterium]